MGNDNNLEVRLAIVIPAYKKEFLTETLESIANQTCKEFVLYIGNDQSPYDLYTIVKKYEDKINVIYKSFNENLGGKDLVAHWIRCVGLVQKESWIWLFSDDDIMELNCVERFYNNLKTKPESDLMHFNITVIDKNGKEIEKGNPFPQHLSIPDFFPKRIKNEIKSTVVEYIFRKSKYIEEGGFANNDLAWCTDDATWIKLGKTRGIDTIAGAIVKWRYSGTNISAIVDDKTIILRKLNSTINHLKWIESYFIEYGIKDNTSQFDKLKWVTSVFLLTSIFSFTEKYEMTTQVIKKLKYSNVKSLAIIYILYLEIKIKLGAKRKS